MEAQFSNYVNLQQCVNTLFFTASFLFVFKEALNTYNTASTCVCQVSEESCRAQFLVPVTARGKNRAQASLERAQNLNPMVKVHADPDRIEEKSDDFFLQFEAVSTKWKCLKRPILRYLV